MISLPNTQALNSKTFRVPQALADGSLVLPELYDWQSENSPSHPLFIFEDGPNSIRTIFWPEAVRAIHRAAHRVSSAIQDDTSLSTRMPVIAILAATDTITYFCFIAGILRAGYTAFPISPRNSPPAIAHLLSKTGAIHLFVSGDSQLQSLARTSIELLQATEEASAVKIYETPVFEDLFPPGAAGTSFMRFPIRHFDMEMPALILHSSGTTGFPKPITWSHKGVLTFAKVPHFGEVDLCGLVIGCHSMPMFHGMGVLQLATVAACGVVMSVFKPTFPAIIPTSKNVFDGAVATHTDILAGVPAFIEVWSRNPEYVDYMKTIKGVIYGGGPLNTECGNFLASQGVSIYINYGSTECGPMCTFLRTNPGMDWEYFSFSGHTRPELLAYPDGTVELIMTKHALHVPCVSNFKVAGVDAYRTNDLLIPHPTQAGLWKIIGRADDQIMLSTGEKTNPVPLETILCQDLRVKSAVVFGRGQFQNGVIVDPSHDSIFDPEDSSRLAEFRDAIWATVEQLNAYAPAHSRLFREMILVASPSKPFTYTSKGTPLRQAIIADYDPEIKALYNAVANTTQMEVPVPKDWKQLQALHFVRNVVRKLLKKTVDDEDDIFQHGCDSLQATWIRNSILRALRETNMAEVAKGLPENLIYQCPTVSSLASCVSKSVLGSVDTQAYVKTDRIQEILDKVDKYSSFRVQPARLSVPNAIVKGDVVLLTGSTGGFGCNILAQLVISKTVTKIYALNRPSFQGTPLSSRQVDALRDHGFNPDALLNPKVVLVECDLTRPTLGISTSLFEEIRGSVTHIIHNAWRVDFNLSLQSFEDNICALKSLIDLALSSPHPTPPRLMFVSSIGIFRHPSHSGLVPETPITDPHVAMGGGYTESKWVGEAILARAAQQTPLRPIIVRLGQLTGSGNGHWNQREWFPSMVKSAVMGLNCLPNLDGLVSWMPSYEAAAALIEMCNSPYDVLHLVHPRPVSWASLITPIAKNIGVPLVSFPGWLDALNTSMDDTSISEVERMHRNPALRLAEFFRHVDLDKDKEPLGVARLDTEYACKVSNILNVTMKQLDEKDAVTWVDAWRRSGFI